MPYFPIFLRPAGEMKSSANEMAQFVRMMLNRGELDGVRIVSPESIARMETPETSLAARAGLKDGYGLGNYADDEEPLTQHGHDGGIDGFLSRYAYVPEAGVGYFFSINDSSPSGAAHAVHEIEHVLYAYMTRGTQAHQEPATKLPTGASEWTGYYQFAAPRQQKLSCFDLLLGGEFVSIKGDTMRARPVLGSARPLIPVGDNQFRTKQSEAATTIFTTDGKDNPVMVLTAPPDIPIPAYYVKTNPIWPMIRLVLVFGAIVLMLSSILFAFIWIPRRILGAQGRASCDPNTSAARDALADRRFRNGPDLSAGLSRARGSGVAHLLHRYDRIRDFLADWTRARARFVASANPSRRPHPFLPRRIGLRRPDELPRVLGSTRRQAVAAVVGVTTRAGRRRL